MPYGEVPRVFRVPDDNIVYGVSQIVVDIYGAIDLVPKTVVHNTIGLVRRRARWLAYGKRGRNNYFPPPRAPNLPTLLFMVAGWSLWTGSLGRSSARLVNHAVN